MTNNLEYEWAVALIEKIVNDHCEKLRSEAELLEGFEARKNATEQIHAIKLAFQKVRNG
jgi:antitoxin component HigA of HigAB toxin-antitoxin module